MKWWRWSITILENRYGDDKKQKFPPDRLIRFDPDHLKQLVINVVNQQPRRHRRRRRHRYFARTETESNEGFTRIVISDDGPGFPADSLKSVFEPFYFHEKGGDRPWSCPCKKNGGKQSRPGVRQKPGGGGAEIVLDIPLDGAEHG